MVFFFFFLFQFQFLDHSIIDNHVEYTISILNPENGQTVFLKSRYSSLLNLHRSLQKLYPHPNFPVFPPKRCIGNLQESFISQRKKILERYFNELFVEKLFFEAKIVQDFLKEHQIHYEMGLKSIEETPNTENPSDFKMTLTLNHSRSRNGLNLSLQRNLSASLRRSSSLKLEDFKKSPMFHSPSSQSKPNNLSYNDDFRLTNELFPLDYFEWLNGILELQGFLLENELVLQLNEEKWVDKLKIKGIFANENEKEEGFLAIFKEKNASYFEIFQYETYKEESCKELGAAVNQLCISKYLDEYKEIIKFQKSFYKEHFEKKTGKVRCLLIIFKEKLNGKIEGCSLGDVLKKNLIFNEKKLLYVFFKILFIVDIFFKNKVCLSDLNLEDFSYDLETQEIKFTNLRNCEYIKEGLLENEKIDIVKKTAVLLIRFKFRIAKEDEEALAFKIKEINEMEIKENDEISTKILKKMLEIELKQVDEVLNEYIKSKMKRKRALDFETNEIVLKKDRLKISKLYFNLNNYNQTLKHLKKLDRETFENIDYSKLTQEEIQNLVNLKLFIIKTLKKSECNALFFEAFLFKSLKLHTDNILLKNISFYAIIQKICKFYISIQDYNKAIDILTKEIYDKNLDPPFLFSVEYNRILSICYREIDDFKSSLYFINKALTLLESKPSSLQVKKADLIKENALIFISTNKEYQIKEGMKLLNKALNIYKASYENSEIDLANTKELIGNCCMKIGEFGLAVQSLEEAWAIKKSISFTVPQSFENLLLNLAKCHYGLKDLNGARSFLKQTSSLLKDKKSNTEDLKPGEEKKLMHIEAELRALKAKVCEDEEKLVSAKNNYRKALKLYKKVVGKSNIILAELYEAYGKISLRMKEIEKGKKCFLRALTIFRLNLGESDVRTLDVAENIADLDFQLGEYEDSLLSYQELVDNYKDKYPEKKEEISDFLIRLGHINFKIGQYSEASENFKDAGMILIQLIQENKQNSEIMMKFKEKIKKIQKDIGRIEELLQAGK